MQWIPLHRLFQQPHAAMQTRRQPDSDRHYKFVLSRLIEGEIKTVTIKRDRAGRLWLCFSVIEEEGYPIPHEAADAPGGAGLWSEVLPHAERQHADSCSRVLPSRSAGAEEGSPRAQPQAAGANNHRRARVRLARVYDRILSRRRDWFFKTAHALCDCYDFIAVEDLNLEG
ncbi:transposase [Rhodothermus marinus]|uniref:transposase n=2 Tax=Rhodothermus marinus TaxID=29549 RepID=UPI00325FB068